ncbi:cytochrome p450 [Stygiomarasmius scandens]|uniref:Cytochrome p450 n=1 Tax=Marasmiellus scandens TaxID=2682957 RepID=A0ABR1J2C5_9AGAR
MHVGFGSDVNIIIISLPFYFQLLNLYRSQNGRFLGMTPYGDEWRKSRKLFHQNFRAEAMVRFHPIEKQQVEKFILGLTKSELPLKDQIETLSQKIMFDALYGLDISSSKDDVPHHAREMLELTESILIPGWDAFKYLPLIDSLPSWFPGGQLRTSYQIIQQEFRKLCEGPWSLMMNDINSRSNSALIPELISGLKSEGFDPEIERIKNMGAQAVAAASDTTMSAISTFWLAMSLYPDIQEKAHQELDGVLSPGKLPDFNDRPSLPYIEAIYREVMRWHPAVPMGLPHVSTEDIHYNGYYIPKGSNIHANIWAMTHDPSVYENPDQFIPERHLREDGQFDSINSILGYGFGRRVCVGRYMADDTVWLAIASVLATVNISSILNENVEDKYTDTSFCSPKSLDLAIHPRPSWRGYLQG